MDEIVKDVRQALQDFLAPELRELKGDVKALDARVTALESTMDIRFDSVQAQMQAGFDKMTAQMQTLGATIREATTRDLSDLRERVARIEERERLSPRH